jgi:UDP-glucose 4-epimerase
METVSLRFFNVYGPRQDPGSAYAAVIPLFVSRLLAGLPLTIYGDGAQTRDFVYVGDVVNALLAASSVPGVSGRVFNVGTGRAVSVRDLAETLCRILWKKPQIEFQAKRAGDITHSWADVAAAARDLGFRASTTLEEGLRRTMEWFATRPAAAPKVRGLPA